MAVSLIVEDGREIGCCVFQLNAEHLEHGVRAKVSVGVQY